MENNLIILLAGSGVALLVLLGWISYQFFRLQGKLQRSLSEQMESLRQQQAAQLGDVQNRLVDRMAELQSTQERRIGELSHSRSDRLNQSNEVLQSGLNKHREAFDERQLHALKIQQENLTQGMVEVRQQVTEALTLNGNELGKKVDALTRSTDERLKEISGQVDKRLNEGV